jgi:hypothetical protein
VRNIPLLFIFFADILHFLTFLLIIILVYVFDILFIVNKLVN